MTKPPPIQYFRQERVADNDIKRWRECATALMETFTTELERAGHRADFAPDLPPLLNVEGAFIQQPFRVLFAWIPDWSPNLDAGHYVIRLDTCESVRMSGTRRDTPHE